MANEFDFTGIAKAKPTADVVAPDFDFTGIAPAPRISFPRIARVSEGPATGEVLAAAALSPLTLAEKRPLMDEVGGRRYQLPRLPPPSQFETPAGRTVGGTLKDLGITGLKAAIGVPETVVGLADLALGGLTSGPEAQVTAGLLPTVGRLGKVLESVGFKPGEARQILESYYSEPQRRANLAVQEATGIVDTAAKAISNPSVIVNNVLESLPSMAAGGVMGRGLIKYLPRVPAWVAGAFGEGTVTAGQQVEQVRQESPGGLITAGQAGQQAAAGVITGGLSLLGGKIAKALKIADADTLLAGGLVNAASKRGLVKVIVYGAAQEGILEELPQSVQEQVWQNIATNKPWDQGVDQAAVLGAFAGAVMGGGAQAYDRVAGAFGETVQPAQPVPAPAPTTPPTPVVPPVAPVSAPPAAGPTAPTTPIAPPAAPTQTVPAEPVIDPAVEERLLAARSKIAGLDDRALAATIVVFEGFPSPTPAQIAYLEAAKAEFVTRQNKQTPVEQAATSVKEATPALSAEDEARIRATGPRTEAAPVAPETPAAPTKLTRDEFIKQMQAEMEAEAAGVAPVPTETLPATAPQLALRLGNGKVVQAVGSLEEAGQLWDRVRDGAESVGEGGVSNMPDATVVDTRTGDVVARISYNGRIWDPKNEKRELVERTDGRGYGKAAPLEAEKTPDYATMPGEELATAFVKQRSNPPPAMLAEIERRRKAGSAEPLPVPSYGKSAPIEAEKPAASATPAYDFSGIKPAVEPTVTWKKAKIVPTREGVKTEVVEAGDFKVGDRVKVAVPGAEPQQGAIEGISAVNGAINVAFDSDGGRSNWYPPSMVTRVEATAPSKKPVTPQVPNEPGQKYVLPSFATGQQAGAAQQRADLKAKRDKLMADFRKEAGIADIGAVFNPKLAGIAFDVITTYVEEGVVVFKDVVRRVAEEYGAPMARQIAPYLARGWKMLQGETVSAEEALTSLPNERTLETETGDENGPVRSGQEGQPGDDGRGGRGDAEAGVRPGVGTDSPASPDSRSGQGNRQRGTVSGRTRKPRTGRVETTPALAPALYRITDKDAIGTGSAKERVSTNLAAIRIVKELAAENRPATSEEQAVLVRYVGWGGLSRIFEYWKNEPEDADDTTSEYWRKQDQVLKELLTDEEYHQARNSTQNAHYTSPTVIKGMWDAVRHLGVKGTGSALETSAGIGHFTGLTPDALRTMAWAMVEKDGISAAVAKALYPGAFVQHSPFEKATLPDNHFAVAISNVPFGLIPITDPSWTGPAFMRHRIHNYFFGKALDKVAPGGLVAFVTTQGTLDSRDNENVRRYLASRADFLGAIRLPYTAFKKNAGTDVVTDMIFLRKRHDGEEPKHAGPWFESKRVMLPNKDGIDFEQWVNEYMLKHPKMVLGKHSSTGKKRAPNQYNVEPTGDLAEQLAEAVRRLPKGSIDLTPPKESLKAFTQAQAPLGSRPYEFLIHEGRIAQNVDGEAVAVELSGADEARVRAILPIRVAVRNVYDLMAAGATDAEVTAAQKTLSAAYDGFVKKHGFLSLKQNHWAFREDPDFPLLLSLEDYDAERDTAVKTPIFTKRTIAAEQKLKTADTPEKALYISLGESGRIDLDRIGDLLGVSADQAAVDLESAGLLINTPSGYQLPAVYLSGNVRVKLREAEVAAAVDPKYQPAVDRLKAVIPADLEPYKIDVKLGAPWVPIEAVQEFVESVTTGRGTWTVTYNPVNAKWDIDGVASERHSRFETPDVDTKALLLDALNDRRRRIRETHQGITTDNRAATALARQRKADAHKAFAAWLLKEDQDRSKAMSRLYNDIYWANVDPTIDGKYLTFPGMADYWREVMVAHQRNAAARVLLLGNTYLDHVVGSGKTLTIISALMELKRLGNARKPMMVVPNHLISQTPGQFLQYYPNAKILVAYEDDLNAANRKRFTARIAAGDWDAVIMPYSAFVRVSMSVEAEMAYQREILDEVEAAILEAERVEAESVGRNESRRGRRRGGTKSPTVKNLERTRDTIQGNLDKLAARPKDDMLTFEQLGVDAMFVDEAHCFPYETPVVTDRGLLPIGEVVEKRLPVLVLSYDTETQATVWKPVVQWYENRRSESFVQVDYDGGSLVCTANHSVWTEEIGYVRADALRPGDHHLLRTHGDQGTATLPGGEDLRRLRADVPVQAERYCKYPEAQILHEPLRGQVAEQSPGPVGAVQPVDCAGPRAGVAETAWSEGSGGVRTDAGAESDARPTYPSEDGARAGRPDVSSARRERPTDDTAAASSGTAAPADGIPNSYRAGAGAVSVAADVLQGGSGRPDLAGCGGGGRPDAPAAAVEVPRRQENVGVIRARVVRVTVLERGRDGRPGPSGRDDSRVYCLGVADTHSFFADGALVSNSFKNLYFPTRQQAAGIPQGTIVQRATDLYLKARYINQRSNYRNLVLASGTPVSNSLAEMFVAQKLLQDPALDRAGLGTLDAWLAQFGLIETKTELAPSGTGMKARAVLTKLRNAPDLAKMFRQVFDVKTIDDLPDLAKLRPKVKGGGPEIVEVPISEYQSRALTALAHRADHLDPRDKRTDNMAKITTDGRMLMLDPRLIDRTLPEAPGSKISKVAENVAEIWKETKAAKGTQLVFLDSGTPGSEVRPQFKKAQDPVTGNTIRRPLTDAEKVRGFDLYADLKNKLVALGVKPGEIAFIHDIDKLPEKKQDAARQSLFRNVRNGVVRVLVGSTEKMGTGMNVQDRGVALHNVDATWTPAGLEQRIGRFLRQGNIFFEADPEGFEIRILNYLTTGSGTQFGFDSYMWQLNERKATGIAQLFNGTSTSRTVSTEMGATALTAAQMKAIATGNPLVIDLGQAMETVEQLELTQQGFEQSQREAEWEIDRARKDLASEEAAVERAEKTAADVEPHEAGTPLKATIGGVSLEGHKVIGEAIIEAAKKETTASDLSPGTWDSWHRRTVLGTIRGLTVALEGNGKTIPHVTLRHPKDVPDRYREADADGTYISVRVPLLMADKDGPGGMTWAPPVPVMMKVMNAVDEIQRDGGGGDGRWRARWIKELKAKIASYESILNQTFDQQGELDAAIAKVEELSIALGLPVPQRGQQEEVVQDDTDDDPADDNDIDSMSMAGWRPRRQMMPLPQRTALARPASIQAPARQMNRYEILTAFRKFFADVPFGTRRFSQRAVGIYKPDVRAIRTRVSQDLQVILHELGHHVDKAVMKLRPAKAVGKAVKVARELEALGEATTPLGRLKDRPYKRKEGAAEYLRTWFTEPERVAAVAPAFTQLFEDYLAANPEFGTFLRSQQAQIQGLLAMTPEQELEERVDWNGERGRFARFRDWALGTETDKRTGFQRMNDALNDDALPFLRVEQAMQAGLPVEDYTTSAYVAFRTLAGTSGEAQTFLEDGIRKPDGSLMGFGLFEAIKDVWNSKDYKPFVQYIVARRAQEYHEQGLESGIRPASVDAVMAAPVPDRFAIAAEKVTQYWDTLLQWAVGKHYLSADMATAMRRRNTRYVPFERVMDAADQAFRGAGTKKQNTPQAIKARTGSARRIVDPIVTSIKNTFTFVRTVEENAARLKLVDLVQQEGGAQFLERVSMKQIATRFNLNRVRTAILDVLASNGVELGEDLPNDVNFDAAVTVFTPAIIAVGDSRIVTVLRDGKREWYEVHDDAIWDTLVAAQPSTSTNAVFKAMSAAASLLRRTATSTLSFVNRNIIRDTIDAKTKAQYHHTFLKSLAAAGLILRNDESYQRFRASKAAQASIVSVDRDYARNTIKRLQHGAVRRVLDHTVFNPFEGLRALAELSDNATRLQSFMETEKKLRAAGVPGAEAETRAAFTSRESTQDFAKMGSVIRKYNRYEAFLGARVGGYTRIATELGNPKRRNGYLFKAFMYGVLPGLILWALNRDDEEYDELPAWERATYWHVPNGMGGWIRIPRPFDVGDVGNVLEAYLDWAVDHDDQAVQRLPFAAGGSRQDLLKLFMTLTPTAVLPWVEAAANYDTFRKRPIISPFDLDLPIDQQYSQWTSGFSKRVGPAIGLAPAMLDHVIYGYTSASGQFISEMASKVEQMLGTEPPAPSKGWRGVPGVGAFVGQKATSQASSIERFRQEKDSLDLYQRGVNRAQKEGHVDDVAARKAERPDAAAELGRLRAVDTQIRFITKNISLLRQREDLDSDQKRELYDRFYDVVIDLARKANKEEPLPPRHEAIDPALAVKVPFGVRHWLLRPNRIKAAAGQ